MSWGTRRRNTIIFIVILILIIPVIVGTFFVFYEEPNCFDGKQNGYEAGVDCGGNCELLCTSETLDPTVVWERFFEVKEGVYNVVAYVENPNPSAGVLNAPYEFKLFNREGVMIADKKGVARLRPKSVLPILESGLKTLRQVPERVSFEFTSDLVFEKETPAPLNLIVKDENYFVDNFPKVSAKIQNINFERISNISVIVLLYDVFDNVVGSSSTFIDSLGGEETKDVTFTWPQEFDEEVSRIEIVPIYEPVF
jgi:hypothetical protein